METLEIESSESDPEPEETKEERPFAEPDFAQTNDGSADEEAEASGNADEDELEETPSTTLVAPEPKTRPSGKALWGKSKPSNELDEEDPFEEPLEEPDLSSNSSRKSPSLELDKKSSTAQSELSFDSSPKGRFEGEEANVVDGEDLDLPPFLRKKKS